MLKVSKFRNISIVAFAVILSLLKHTGVLAQQQQQDLGPSVSISGIQFPGPISLGEVVQMTVSANAQGTNQQTGNPNLISELSLWSAITSNFLSPPAIGKPSNNPSTGEANRSDPYWNAPAPWVFKWSVIPANDPGTGKFPIKASYTWNLTYFTTNGYFWYSGEAQDNWGYNGFSFWSAPYGYYLLSP